MPLCAMDVLIAVTVSFVQNVGIVKLVIGGLNMVITLEMLELQPLLPVTDKVTE